MFRHSNEPMSGKALAAGVSEEPQQQGARHTGER
jgi:hypothetical protein